ncbi:MAG: 50S ribosomal protein L13 [Patescibacteria group bacterium]|nr:50S ribosomal protein L13 [Patescibacteria group bacterium]
MDRETHTIDAENKSLGRLATKVAILLRGKHKRDFARNKDIGDYVVIENVEKIRFTGRKIDQKKYYRHSGYLGSLKEIPLKRLLKTKPSEPLRKAVYGMLPKNRLRAKQIKRLKFEKSK